MTMTYLIAIKRGDSYKGAFFVLTLKVKSAKIFAKGEIMAEVMLAIDFGGSYTKIFRKDFGLVLKEATLIGAVKNQDGYDVKYLGDQAKQIQGKTNEQTIVFSPVSEGQIKAPEYATVLLKHFLKKVVPNTNIFTKIKCLAVYPTGLDEKSRQVYKQVFESAGIKEVTLLPKCLCSAYGTNNNIFAFSSCMVIDFGGVSVDVGVINMGSVISGATLGVGGKSIDNQIVKLVNLKYGVEIGMSSAQKIKEEIASLFSNDTANLEITGMDFKTKTPTSVVVYASDIRECIIPLLDEAVKISQTILNSLSPEISADIIKNGVFIAGEMSNIVGLERYLRKQLNLPIKIVEESPKACILGAGKLLSQTNLIKKLL